jgi:hypothetical protein
MDAINSSYEPSEGFPSDDISSDNQIFVRNEFVDLDMLKKHCEGDPELMNMVSIALCHQLAFLLARSLPEYFISMKIIYD